MISEFHKIEELFKEVSATLKQNIDIYVIGGAVLLYHGLKSATKDIDVVVETKKEFLYLQQVLHEAGFKPVAPGTEYSRMNLSQILSRKDFRLDIFQSQVCGGFSISEGMKKRATKVAALGRLNLFLCSKEDILLFKTMTEREGDLEDCINLAKTGIDWNAVISELKHQIKHSRKDIWITWVGERLDLLEERGVNIPVMKELNVLREEYYLGFEKSD